MKAVHHFEIALWIASAFDRAEDSFWVYFNLADMFVEQSKSSDAQSHVEHMKSFAVMSGEAGYVWRGKIRGIRCSRFEKLESVENPEFARWVLQQIDPRLPGQPGHL